MSARAKFLFDVDFSAVGTNEKAKPTITPAAHEAALADARAAAFREGFLAAEGKAIADAERRLAAAAERIAVGLENLADGLRALEARLEAEAVEVAVAVARKLAPELVAREPLAEIIALAAECFTHLIGAPHVVVRINDALYAEARDCLEAAAHSRGFDGRLVVLAEPDILPGDCRIEWADGGTVRDRAATEAAVSEAVARYLAVRGKAAVLPSSSEV